MKIQTHSSAFDSTLYEVLIQASADLEDRLIETAESVVNQGVHIDVPAIEPNYDFSMHVLFSKLQESKDFAQMIKNQSAFNSCHIAQNDLPAEDWQTSWQAHFKPLEIGAHLLVVPAWESIPKNVNRTIVRIDPGMAFGNGAHGSTMGALTLLEQINCQGKTLLDVGTGSGILAIAAVKYGADRVIAIDNDPLCQQVAQRNSVLNKTVDKIDFCTGTLSDLQLKFVDGLVANITADVHEYLLENYLKFYPSFLILSGISPFRAQSFFKFLNNLPVTIEDSLEIDGWRSVLLKPS